MSTRERDDRMEGNIMKPAAREYSELDDEWEVDEAQGLYVSKSHGDRDGHGQRLIFDETFRDGTISAEIIIREGVKLEDGREPKIGAIAFRFQDPNNYYYAGLGANGGRFCIAKKANGQDQVLVSMGSSSSIRKGVRFRIQVRCVGNRITLTHNGITQLSVFDDSFNSGPWGLTTWRTVAEFRGLSANVVNPTCFVIMPFAPEFHEVYQVIRETVEGHGFACVRADERYLLGPIIEDITEQVEKSDLVVADFTGKNPNVFYEAGYAAALRKPVIQIAQSVGDLPFDVRHLRTFSYTTKILGDRKLGHDLSEAIKATTGFGATPTALNGS